MTFDEADALYPFAPGTQPESFRDFEKLRAIEHPTMRRLAWEAITERDRKARGQQWAPKRPDPRLTPASREFLDDKRRASGDDEP